MKLNKIGPGVVSVKTWALVIVVANVNSAAVGKKVAGVVADTLRRAGYVGEMSHAAAPWFFRLSLQAVTLFHLMLTIVYWVLPDQQSNVPNEGCIRLISGEVVHENSC